MSVCRFQKKDLAKWQISDPLGLDPSFSCKNGFFHRYVTDRETPHALAPSWTKPFLSIFSTFGVIAVWFQLCTLNFVFLYLFLSFSLFKKEQKVKFVKILRTAINFWCKRRPDILNSFWVMTVYNFDLVHQDIFRIGYF